jgi:hypothetical protein
MTFPTAFRLTIIHHRSGSMASMLYEAIPA